MNDRFAPFSLGDTLPTAALKDIRVINIAVNVPGPWVAARMASLGANVTSFEPPSGDPLRHLAPSWHEEFAGAYEVQTLDLKSEDGKAQLAGLLADADVLITSHRPAALERMGVLGVVEKQPRLCHIEIVGDVDDPEHPGHDLTYQAEAGTLTPPTMPTVLLGDLMGAERAFSAALGLLLRRSETGEGGRARVGLRQGALAASTPLRHGVTAPGALLGGGIPNYGIYEAADGWLAVATLEPHFARGLAEAVGEDVASSKEALAAHLKAQTVDQVLGWAREHDLPIVRIR